MSSNRKSKSEAPAARGERPGPESRTVAESVMREIEGGIRGAGGVAGAASRR